MQLGQYPKESSVYKIDCLTLTCEILMKVISLRSNGHVVAFKGDCY